MDGEVGGTLRDLVVEAEPDEALDELVEAEGQRHHAQGELAGFLDLRQRGDADTGDHRPTDEVRFRGEAHWSTLLTAVRRPFTPINKGSKGSSTSRFGIE